MWDIIQAVWRNPKFYFSRMFPGILGWATFCLLLPSMITKSGIAAQGLGVFVMLATVFGLLWLLHFPFLNVYPRWFGHRELDSTKELAKGLYYVRYGIKVLTFVMTLLPALGALLSGMQSTILLAATLVFVWMEGRWLWNMEKAKIRGEEDVVFIFVKDWNAKRREQ